MIYDKDSRGYILTPDEVADLNKRMDEAKRQYEAVKRGEWFVPWIIPSRTWKS